MQTTDRLLPTGCYIVISVLMGNTETYTAR